MYILIGKIALKCKRITTTAIWEVVKDSEKAIQFREIVTITRNRNGSVASQEENSYWLPKSQISRFGNVFSVPKWLAKEKEMWAFSIRPISPNGQVFTPEDLAKGMESGDMAVSMQNGKEIYYPAGRPDISPAANSFTVVSA